MNNSTLNSIADQASCRFGVSVFFTTVMVIISVAAFTGNILVIVAVCKTPRLRTSTNYYYVNMAVSDFFSCLITWPLYLTDEIVTSSGSLLQGSLATIGCKVGVYFKMLSASIHSKPGFDCCRQIRCYCLPFKSASDQYKTEGSLTVCNLVDINGLLHPHVLLFQSGKSWSGNILQILLE